jgi:transposase-like protein
MHDFTTELVRCLSSGMDPTEFFRSHLEKAINHLLETERTAFLDYEKWDPIGYHSGNSRNGYYTRSLKTIYGTLELQIPRDRLGEFNQQTVPPHKRRAEDLERTIIQLYQKGITTREIADLIEKMYGHHYSATTISNIAKLLDKDVKAFHGRTMKPRYVAVYCDATYLNVRRDTVAKEALHLLIGIDAEGIKEVLDYALYPTESAENYKEMLLSLRDRGLQEVLLFISDGLMGLPERVTDVFPKARHQACWTHLQRNVLRKVRPIDAAEVTAAMRRVHQAESLSQAQERLQEAMTRWRVRYPKLAALFEGKENLFSYFAFPEPIRRSLYTNNLAESLNKRLKRVTRSKEQFPHEDALERTVCANFLECNAKWEGRKHRGWSHVTYELLEMFSSPR